MADLDASVLDAFSPNAYGLVRRISPRISDRLLDNIAGADYGHDADAHYAAIRRIRDGGPIDAPLLWVPKEVLELRRWTEPDAVNRSGREGELADLEGHWVRAFSCAVLMKAYGDPETGELVDGEGATCVQLLESTMALDEDVSREAVGALAWLLPRIKRDWGERNYVGIALLFVALKSKLEVSSDALEALARWLIAEEGELFDVFGYGLGQHDTIWQLRLSHNLFDRKWMALGRKLVALAAKGERHDSAISEVARLLAGEILP
ncbi:MAG: hypothetical protein AB7S70_04035 [Hyphomicrobium sp.]|uniref:hypothetical protein n=1 Tax=Hyphomicrobium sp. TaxID=82 RepID=UPI003D0F7725